MSLQDRRVLLTGASGAIGSEVARRLAARGARLVLSARREGRLGALAEEIELAGGTRPAVVAADLSRPGAAAELATAAVEAGGPIDVLINNAGTSAQGLTWVVGDRDEARDVFEANLWSPAALVAALAPGMIERGRGAIVNVGSMARVSPFPHLGHYSASRAALAVLTQTMGLELGPRGVRVVEVALGPVDTPASRENRRLQGAEAWLDGRPGIGKAAGAAETIVSAVEGSVEGVVFYRRPMRWAHRFPGIGGAISRRFARGADLEDETVRPAGHGDGTS